jgi:hypothetical protein
MAGTLKDVRTQSGCMAKHATISIKICKSDFYVFIDAKGVQNTSFGEVNRSAFKNR